MKPPHKSTKEEVEYYQKQLLQRGGSHLHGPVFIARYNQRGYGFGSVLSGLARNLIKVLGRSTLLASTKQSLKRRALEAGSNLAKDVLKDKKGLKKSLKEGAKNLISDVITDVISSGQVGKGKKRKRVSHEEDDIFKKKKRRSQRKITDVFQS